MTADYRKIAAAYGTPFYLFDTRVLRDRVRTVRAALAAGTGRDIGLCFAMKANPMLIGPLASAADCFEVCSPGEFRICEKAGIPREKIVLSGVYKEEADIARILDTYGNAGIFTAESENQYELLFRLAKERGLRIPVLLRLTSGNQFGMDEETILRIAAGRERTEAAVKLLGLQLYGGTQKKKADRIRRELGDLDRVMAELQDRYGLEPELLEYGPGLGLNYFAKDKPFDEAGLLQELSAAVRGMRYRGRTVFEAGRFLAASCGVYVTRVGDIKTNCGVKYLITDGGINHLNYYGQTLAMQVPFLKQLRDGPEDGRKMPAEEEPCTVCGALCTTADVMIRNIMLKKPEIGDILVFENTGAYSVTESMYLFLSRDLPAVLFADEDGRITVHRERRGTDLINA